MNRPLSKTPAEKLESLIDKPKNLNPLEKEKKAKLAAGGFEEVIEATGQESDDKAEKWVIETEKEEQKQSQEHSDRLSELFAGRDARRSIKTYQELLAKVLYNGILRNLKFPKGWQWRVTHSVRGVAVTVKDGEGNFHSKGFKPVGEQKFDLRALSELYWKVENLLDDYDQEKGKSDRSDNGGQETSKEDRGVILPSQSVPVQQTGTSGGEGNGGSTPVSSP